MSARLASAFLLALVMCYTMGCALHTSVLLRNESGQRVRVYSAHTGQTHMIKNKSREDIPHTCGEISITTDTGTIWNYADVSFFSLDQTKHLQHGRKGLFMPKVTLRLLLEKDGSLHFLPPDATQGAKHLVPQPPGFPLRPTTANIPRHLEQNDAQKRE
ncbi:MAG: hypothetical protein ACOX5G_01090 [Kiritimatiellia bacterium]|jgi:hypothetical protein